MSQAKPLSVLLTLEDVLSWKRERDEMAARIAELDKKLFNVSSFMSEEALVAVFGTADVPGRPKARDERAALSAALMDIAEREMRLMSVSQFETMAKASDAADVAIGNPGLVEDLLGRLARHSRLRKRGELFMHPAVKEEIPPRNVPSSSSYGEADYFRSIIIAELTGLTDGATPSYLIEALKADPRGARKIEGNIQYPYSLLGRMVDKQQIQKYDGRFYHPDIKPSNLLAVSEDKSETAATRNGSAATAVESPEGSTALPDAAHAAQYGTRLQSRH